MSEPEFQPDQPEHSEKPDCWCGPILLEICPECDPFDGVDLDSPEGERQVKQAMCVRVPMVGVQARRPKKSRGCWRCGEYGLNMHTAQELANLGEAAGVTLVIHRQQKTSPATSAPGTEPCSEPASAGRSRASCSTPSASATRAYPEPAPPADGTPREPEPSEPLSP